MNIATTSTPSAPDAPLSQRGTPTWELAREFPLQGDWTEADFLSHEWEQRAELVDGCLEFLPMTARKHQKPLKGMEDALTKWCAEHQPDWEVYPPIMPIRLWPGRLRDPDVRVLRPTDYSSDTEPPHGAALVVEIVSPQKRDRDRDYEAKVCDYARAGIPEYWIVDPESRRVKVLALADDAYRTHGEFTGKETATSASLEGFAVAVSDLFVAE